MQKLNLKIVTPEQVIFDQAVDMVTLTTKTGEIGILPNHINLMSKVIEGPLVIKEGSKEEIFTLGDGFLQVFNNTATILVDLAFSEKQGSEALKKAQQLKTERQADFEYADTLVNLTSK